MKFYLQWVEMCIVVSKKSKFTYVLCYCIEYVRRMRVALIKMTSDVKDEVSDDILLGVSDLFPCQL